MVIFKTQSPFYYMVSKSVPTAQKKVVAYPWKKVLEYGATSACRRPSHPVYKSGTMHDLERDKHLFFWKWYFGCCRNQAAPINSNSERKLNQSFFCQFLNSLTNSHRQRQRNSKPTTQRSQTNLLDREQKGGIY